MRIVKGDSSIFMTDCDGIVLPLIGKDLAENLVCREADIKYGLTEKFKSRWESSQGATQLDSFYGRWLFTLPVATGKYIGLDPVLIRKSITILNVFVTAFKLQKVYIPAFYDPSKNSGVQRVFEEFLDDRYSIFYDKTYYTKLFRDLKSVQKSTTVNNKIEDFGDPAIPVGDYEPALLDLVCAKAGIHCSFSEDKKWLILDGFGTHLNGRNIMGAKKAKESLQKLGYVCKFMESSYTRDNQRKLRYPNKSARVISEEAYNRAMKQPDKCLTPEDMKVYFNVAELAGYGVYNIEVKQDIDGEYIVLFNMGSSCD